MTSHQEERPKYLTTNEVAELCRASPETVRYWRYIGTGPTGFKVGRRVLYDIRDVERWISGLRSTSEQQAAKLTLEETFGPYREPNTSDMEPEPDPHPYVVTARKKAAALGL